MAQARVKGLCIGDVAASLEAALERGELSRERVEAELEAEDLAILDAKVDPDLWYPVAAMGRMLRLLLDLNGGGSPEQVQVAARASSSLYLERPSFREVVGEARRRGEKGGDLLLALPRSLFGFGRWRLEAEAAPGGHPRVVFEEGGALPDLVASSTAGVMEGAMSIVSGSEMRVRVERPAPDRLHFDFRPA
jgi:hypothetical protein